VRRGFEVEVIGAEGEVAFRESMDVLGIVRKSICISGCTVTSPQYSPPAIAVPIHETIL
jgi:hypothetical protein